MTDLYAVIGNPIAHSKSPFIHTEFSRQTGQAMRYEALLAPLDGFAKTVNAFRQQGGKGMNVTVPFKLAAHKLVTQLTERASMAQAVNTIKFDEARILGDNTDGIGLERDITNNLGIPISDKRILLMGAGGAARGVILPLLEANPKILVIANRTKSKAHALHQQFAAYGKLASGDFADLSGENFDIIINATSASLHDALPPLPAGIFCRQSLAYDMMYSQKLTPFLTFAQQQGAKYLADGIGMLVEQAAESFFLWRDVRPETKHVIELLKLST
jgi:shikimate dehydrogenase